MKSLMVFFFFKQKTAYEMRISDWSSDVCSSDLEDRRREHAAHDRAADGVLPARACSVRHRQRQHAEHESERGHQDRTQDRKSVVEGKSVSVRVDLGGRRIMTNKEIVT